MNSAVSPRAGTGSSWLAGKPDRIGRNLCEKTLPVSRVLHRLVDTESIPRTALPGVGSMGSERRSMPEQELSIREREQELFVDPQETPTGAVPTGAVKPFPIYL